MIQRNCSECWYFEDLFCTLYDFFVREDAEACDDFVTEGKQGLKTTLDVDCDEFVEIKCDAFNLKQPLNTIHVGFVRMLGVAICAGQADIYLVNNAVQSSLMNFYFGVNSLHTSLSVHNFIMSQNAYNVNEIQTNTSLSSTFFVKLTGTKQSHYDVENDILRVSEYWINSANANTNFLVLYLLGPHCGAANSMWCGLAGETLNSSIPPSAQFENSYTMRIDKYHQNLKRWLTLYLGAENTMSDGNTSLPTVPGWKLKNGNIANGSITRYRTLDPRLVMAGQRFIEIGYSGQAMSYDEEALIEPATNTDYGLTTVNLLAFNTAENYFDLEISVLATNTSIEPQTYREIGIFRPFPTTATAMEMGMSHRGVFETPVTVPGGESGLFTQVFRVYIHHKPVYRVSVLTSDDSKVETITNSGNYFEEQVVTVECNPLAGQTVQSMSIVPSVPFEQVNQNTIKFVMPSFDLAVHIVFN